MVNRCEWCTDDAIYIKYHDQEWGKPSYEYNHLFEMLILEGFQAGLSWLTILRKREAFRRAFFDFDVKSLALADDDWLQSCLQNTDIVRNRLKLTSTVINAKAWLSIQDPVAMVWSVVGGKPIINNYKNSAEMPVAGEYAHKLSKILKKNGFKFVGPTICQSYLQAVGCLMDHTTDCFRYDDLSKP